jgi:hypothetical protein
MLRRTGLLWDPSDPIESKRPISAKYGFKFGGFSDASMPEELMQSDRDDIRDQGPTESCTGQALTDAARTSCILRGVDPGPLSALTSYAAARIKGGDPKYLVDGEGYKLWTDEGAYTTPLMQGAGSYGFAPESAWPFDPEKVNDVPDFGALVRAHDLRIPLNAWEKVTTAQEIRRAMVAKCTVIIALRVTDVFLDNEDGLVDRMIGNVRGGHMMALRGYGHETVRGAKTRGFDGVNSWGTGWGDHGWFFVTDEVIESDACLVAVAIKVAPGKVVP